MTATTTDHVQEFLDKYREQEAAFLRFQNNEAAPGDYMLLNGTEFQSKEREHKDRLSGVQLRRSRAGTSKQWAAARQTLETAKQNHAKVTARNNPRIQELQAELDRLRSENATASKQLSEADSAVNVMRDNRELLQSKVLLPPIVLQEIDLLEQRAFGPRRRELNAIHHHIKELSIAGSGGNPLYISAARQKPEMAGYAYWRTAAIKDGRGLELWSDFEQWAGDKIEDLKAELQKIFDSCPADIRARIDSLKQFYTADIE